MLPVPLWNKYQNSREFISRILEKTVKDKNDLSYRQGRGEHQNPLKLDPC